MTVGALEWSGRGVLAAPVIDRTVIGEWLDGDNAAIDELLGIFRDSVIAEAELMRDLLARDDLDQFAHSAHRLRGAALSMGARSLADFVGLLFTAARARDQNACIAGMPVLATHVQLVEAEIPAGAPSAQA
jgi:HPt (histidine-containing phosphotransfer) domain-containing protein